MVSLIITRFVYRPFLARVLLLVGLVEVVVVVVAIVAIDIVAAVAVVVVGANKQMFKFGELTLV